MENYNAKYNIGILRNIYLMTNCEIATLLDVKPLTVSRWNNGWSITKENYEKLEKIKYLLANKNIKYKGEAFDFLNGELKK